ncbi:hypothetical protein [Mycolicibacterium canariasense]|uniref:hypothetical protein n=1 Tax=Mycolicibacterium canariasense TaxID=228230 RepID=UPI0032D5A82D
MAWGAAYETPDEQAEKQAQREAAARVDQRRQMSAFEQQAIDVLREVSEAIAQIAEIVTVRTHPTGRYCPDCGAEQPILRDQGITGGEAGDASAGPGDPSGPARPETYRCSEMECPGHPVDSANSN